MLLPHIHQSNTFLRRACTTHFNLPITSQGYKKACLQVKLVFIDLQSFSCSPLNSLLPIIHLLKPNESFFSQTLLYTLNHGRLLSLCRGAKNCIPSVQSRKAVECLAKASRAQNRLGNSTWQKGRQCSREQRPRQGLENKVGNLRGILASERSLQRR